jgi:hypothetical protein
VRDWWNTPISTPYYYLAVGVICLVAAVVSTCTGKTYGRYGGWASRLKEPNDFWGTVAIYYVGGICFIGYFFWKMYGHLN